MRSILLYTGDQWGTAQRDVYRQALDQAFTRLSANPLLGRSRDEIAPGLRSYNVQQHVIYYRITAGTVMVLRILHGKMDAARPLKEI